MAWAANSCNKITWRRSFVTITLLVINFLGLLSPTSSSSITNQGLTDTNCSSSDALCSQFNPTSLNRRQDTAKRLRLCVVPKQPKHGKFTVLGQDSGLASGSLVEEFTVLKYSCDPPYKLSSRELSICENSQWDETPACKELCRGLTSSTLDLNCMSGLDGTMIPCDKPMPYQSIVISACKPGYTIYTRVLPLICTESGNWSSNLTQCKQVCGIEESSFSGRPLIFNGQDAKPEDFPWHVGLYSFGGVKPQWNQICGGTIIRSNIIITAAHCVCNNYDGTIYLANNYRVAAGKYYRDYYDQSDSNSSQILNVAKIFVPERYGGTLQSHQEDLALLLLESHISFADNVKPVCLDVRNKIFDDAQISQGVSGKVAGWGLTSSGGVSSPRLQNVTLPVIDYPLCKERMPETFWKYLTPDKFCAGYSNGQGALCQGDSGGGLVFNASEAGVTRWYLRGLVSVSPTDIGTGSCSEYHYTAFTRVYALGMWIEQVLKDISSAESMGISLIEYLRHLSDLPNLSEEDITRSGACIAPEPPEFGSYTILRERQIPDPGTVLDEYTSLQYFCKSNFQLSTASNIVVCDSSRWSAAPICQKNCRELTSTTVKMTCTSGIDGRQISCNQSLPHRSTITSTCKPGYFGTNLRKLTCLDGDWDYILPQCYQNHKDCGLEITDGVELTDNGTVVMAGEFPWHVGVYTILDQSKEWRQICSGTIITNNYILTAAHCVWNEDYFTAQPPENFKVAAGKLYSNFYDKSDTNKTYVQMIHVKQVHTAAGYRGEELNHRGDMALLTLYFPISFSNFVHPICFDDKDVDLKRRQPFDGKVAGWGLSFGSGAAYPQLMTSTITNVLDLLACRTYMPSSFKRFLTSDKFCAGETNSTSLCLRDSGGGLVFSKKKEGVTRWYLRGIVGVVPVNETTHTCTEYGYTIFTQVTKLADWLSQIS